MTNVGDDVGEMFSKGEQPTKRICPERLCGPGSTEGPC